CTFPTDPKRNNGSLRRTKPCFEGPSPRSGGWWWIGWVPISVPIGRMRSKRPLPPYRYIALSRKGDRNCWALAVTNVLPRTFLAPPWYFPPIGERESARYSW